MSGRSRGYKDPVAVCSIISGKVDLVSFPIHLLSSMNPAGLQTVLQHVNGTSESFISAYYTAWDKDRPTLSSLYTPNSRIVWNGNPISGLAAYEQFIAKMPATKHDVRPAACAFALRSSLQWLTCCVIRSKPTTAILFQVRCLSSITTLKIPSDASIDPSSCYLGRIRLY